MTRNMMPPDQVCDVMDFLEKMPWGLAKPVVQRSLAMKFGWRIERSRRKDYLVNHKFGLNEPDVAVISDGEQVLSLDWRTTDIIRDVTDESREFLGDAFTLLVREGEQRWGAAGVKRDGGLQNALWDTRANGRIRFTGSDMDVLVEYRTPQGTDLERRERRSS